MKKKNEGEKIECLSDYIKKKAKTKKCSVLEWWNAVMIKFPLCSLATHVGKYTHPDSKVFLYYRGTETCVDDYICSDTVKGRLDIVVSSSANSDIVSFLMKKLNTKGETVFDDLSNGGANVKKELDSLGLDFNVLKEGFDSLLKKPVESPKETEDILKQVFFPVNEYEYHLLTPIISSSLLYEESKRINSWNKNVRQCRDSKYECFGQEGCEIRNVMQISFGGAQPHNISGLNSTQKGKYSIIEAMPPILKKKNIRIPRKNFFFETIYYKRYTDLFRRMHHLLLWRIRVNNKNSRDKLEVCVLDIIDEILASVYQLRQEPAGWSETSTLTQAQKIWLDELYTIQRKESEWIPEIGLDFSRWLIEVYEKVMGTKAVKLGDDWLILFKRIIEESLEKELRMK